MREQAFVDTEQAQANRERLTHESEDVKQYYAKQQHAVGCWEMSRPPPRGLALGELPELGHRRTVPKRIKEE